MYIEGQMQFNNGTVIECGTDYPYELSVNYKIKKGNTRFAIHIPGWSHNSYSVYLGDKRIDNDLSKGYIYLDVKEGDEIKVVLDDSIKKIYCSTKVSSNLGQVAIQRGPLVYCAEGVDNDSDVLGLVVKDGGYLKALEYDENLLSGIIPIEVEGYRIKESDTLYSDEKPEKTPCTIKMVPYYTWGNRGINEMKVWLPEK